MNQPVEINAATELYGRLTQQAALRQLSIVDLFQGAATLMSLQQRPLVAELYKTWIALNCDHELLHAVYFNYGVTLVDLRDLTGGINAFRHSIRLKPDFEPPYINLGRALEDIGHTGPAIGEWMKLINKLSGVTGETVSHKLTVMHQTARVLEGLGNDVMAEEILRQSLEIDRRQTEAVQHWVSLRQRQCKWPVLQESDRVARKDLLNGISTLSLANLTDDPMFQLAKAYHYARHSIGMPKPVRPHGQPGAGRRDPLRLRIGYVSSDLRDHAVGFAMTDVVE
jgi:predicted O-linked N-acetylglucosamine transferase (SPINDLY family)